MRWRACSTIMACLALWLVGYAAPPHSSKSTAASLVVLPTGSTLPVILQHKLSAEHVAVGDRVVARLSQRVPLPNDQYLPAKAELVGHVSASDARSLALQFTQLKLAGQTEPIAVRLLAAAHWMDVGRTAEPLDGGDRATSNPADWTTMQIGRDEVYRSSGSGTVYNQCSEPVGHADLYGVYAPPLPGGSAMRAMGPFSTTAKGIYELPGVAIEAAGGSGQPIVLRLSSPKWQIDSGTALLLEVVGGEKRR
jgi:hypothetical protein